MRIVGLDTFTRSRVSMVRVRTDSGDEGWGQTSPYDADISATVLHRHLAPVVLGRGPLEIADLVDACIEATYKFPGTYVRRALAGVETALWDLRGRLEGRGVCELLGGRPRRVPVYGSSMRRDITPEAEAERLLALRETAGYRAFKARIGKVCGHDEDEWPGRTEALIEHLRRALGGDVTLLADANSCYTVPKAIEVGRRLEDHGFGHFEEPCPYWEVEWTAEVAAALEIPVAGGEQDCMLPGWRRMIAMRAVDYVQPDVCYVGGMVRALRVAELAAEAGLLCVPHAANRSMVAVFTLHLLAAIPNPGEFMEFSIEESPWTEGLYEPRLEVVDGAIAVPAGPGWGVTVNPDWLAAATYAESSAD